MIPKNARAKEIVILLKEHGALSIRGLSQLMTPQISPRSLRYAISRLSDKGFIERVYDQHGNPFSFFRLTTNFAKLAAIRNELNCDLIAAKEAAVRRSDLYHTEQCAIVTQLFRHRFMDFSAIGESQFVDHPIVSHVLLEKQADFRMRPDIMLVAKTNSSSPVTIAIEVERTLKTNDRVHQKLLSFAKQSLLDGVIFISSSDRISEQARRIYNNQVVINSKRISHYGNNFFLFGTWPIDSSKNDLLFLNAALENTSAKLWLEQLVMTKNGGRSDRKIKMHSSGGMHSNTALEGVG